MALEMIWMRDLGLRSRGNSKVAGAADASYLKRRARHETEQRRVERTSVHRPKPQAASPLR